MSVRWLALAFVAVSAAGAASREPLSKAEDLYQHTAYRSSLALLDKNTDDPATNFLIGRNYFMSGDLKQATDYLVKATQEQPRNSEYMDWLGRAYGRRAETSSFVVAPGFASKARQSFERAVDLDPKNREALSDLFDYYLDAPGFMGGGHDKAVALVDKTAAIDPPEAHYQRARLAQKRKEYVAAEAQLRQFVAADQNNVGPLLALAQFLATQGRYDESDAVFHQAEILKPDSPSVWYKRADVLIKQKRDLEQARSLLEKYMRASVTPDDPPKEEAARLLKQAGGA